MVGPVNLDNLKWFRPTYFNAVALYVYLVDYAGGGDYEITIPLDYQYFSLAELLERADGPGRFLYLFKKHL